MSFIFGVLITIAAIGIDGYLVVTSLRNKKYGQAAFFGVILLIILVYIFLTISVSLAN